MTTLAHDRATAIGLASAVAASLCFSVNDVTIKFLSGGYALHEVVLVRSLVGTALLLAIVVPMQGGWRMLRTRHLGIHLLRGACVVFSNMCFFLGLAAMPLAETVAIFFVSPLIITLFSVAFLGERVGPRRWAAVVVGLVGVLVVMRPGTSAFQPASVLPLFAAIGYAALHTLTRRIGVAESAVTMAVYVQLVFIVVSAGIGLAVGDGRFAGDTGPSMEFFLRAWIWPQAGDLWLLAVIGVCSAAGGYFIAQAYRLCEAGLAASFEYVAMPLAVFWGLVVFGEWPDLYSWIGTTLIVGAGLFMFRREAMLGRRPLSFARKRLP